MKIKNDDIYEAGFDEGYRAGLTAVGKRKRVEPRNQGAFVIGLIAGFFGLWGLSYVLNGKVGNGCLWMFFVGPFIAAALSGLTLASGGLGAIFTLPLWLGIVYVQAKNGASNL